MLYHGKINTGGYLVNNLLERGGRPHIPSVAVVYYGRGIERWYYNKLSEAELETKNWVQKSGEQYRREYALNTMTVGSDFPDYSVEGIPIIINPSLPDYPRGI